MNHVIMWTTWGIWPSILKAEQELIPTSGAEQRPLAEVEQPRVRHATPFRTISPTPPLSFHEFAIQVASQNVALANMNLIFDFRNVQLAIMNMAFGHCACDFIQASTPVQQCLFNVCLLSSSIFTHGHRPAVNDYWSLGSQVTLVVCFRCPGFCVFCGCF